MEKEIIKIPWNPSKFYNYPPRYKQTIKIILLLKLRDNCLIHYLPRDILFLLFELIYILEYSFPQSTLLSIDHQNIIHKWLPGKKWDLIYK